MRAPQLSGFMGLAALVLAGCPYVSQDVLQNKLDCIDQDHDGVPRVPHNDDADEYVCGGIAQDCDDADAARFPGNPEVPYDKIDQDCDDLRQDLVDVDGDGFPGIAKSDWDQITRDSGEEAAWEAGVVEGNKKADFDCDDDPSDDAPPLPTAAQVNPTITEVFYDGVDANCDAKDDYDLDGDGYAPDEAEWNGTVFSTSGLTDLPGGDCADRDKAVNPGVAEDTWYDGIDSNCDQVNDFDQDGDGYMPPPIGSLTEAAWRARFFAFCQDYIGTTGTGSDPDDFADCWDTMYPNGDIPAGSDEWDLHWSDCADEGDPSAPTPYLGEDVYPGAPDDLYDGIDSDCGKDNDFDGDGDLYIDGAYEQDFADYADYWQIEIDDCHDISVSFGLDNDKIGYCGGWDCDDDDETVHPNDPEDVRPGIAETLGDPSDQDCNGDDNSAVWVRGPNDWAWKDPRNVQVGRSSQHWYLVTGAAETGAIPNKNAGLAILFDPEAAVDDDPYDTFTWFTPSSSADTTQIIGGRVDSVPTTDGFFVGAPYTHDQTGTNARKATYLLTKRVYWDTTLTSPDYRSKTVYRDTNGILDTQPDVDLRVDWKGRLWGYSCGEKTSIFTLGGETSAFTTIAKGCYGEGTCDGGARPAAAPTQCFVEPPANGSDFATGYQCTATGCLAYTLDGVDDFVTPTSTNPYASLATGGVGIDYQNGYRVHIKPSGTGVDIQADGATSMSTILSGYTVKAAMVDAVGTTLYVIAVVTDQTGDGANDVVTAYGPAATLALTPSAQSLTLEGETFQPTEVAVYGDTDRIMYAVSGDSFNESCLDPATSPTRCDIVAWQFMLPRN